jgi:hypothetical protein
VSAVAALLMAGYGSATASAPASAESPGGGPPSTISAQALSEGADHACVVGAGHPDVAWSALRNPILSFPTAGAKDEALLWASGTWHMLFSYVTEDPRKPGGISWDIAGSTSRDLVHWSAARPWPAQPGVLGVASPDLVSDPTGGYLVTYQSDPGASGATSTEARLFYRTSKDLATWSAPRALAPALAPAPGDRMIDGALAFTGHQLLLGFKFSSPTQPDIFELARSTSGTPAGPWQLVGRPDITVNGDTIENYQFVHAAGRWRLVATSNTLDQPWLFTLAGDPSTAIGWLQWKDGYQLAVPSQAFDRGPGISSVNFEHANSAYLCDASSLPGHYYYLVYAGSDELTAFDGWGHAKIGIARSTDLVHWQVPAG